MSEGHLYKSKIKPEVAVYLETYYPGFFEKVLRLAQTLIAFYGETTGDGAADGSTLICSDLTGQPDFDGNQVVILSGKYDGQARDINGVTTGGTVTPHLTFGGQITVGTKFVILALRTVPAEVAGLVSDVADIEAKLDHASHGLAALLAEIDANETKIDDLEAKLDKLAGETPVTGATIAHWNSGVATSGNPGADLVTLGADGVRYKVHSLLVSIRNLTVGAQIDVRLYQQVNGVEDEVYVQTFVPGTDPDGLWIINGTVGIHEAVRVEVFSNDAGDDGKAVDYDYMLEAM